MAERLSYCAAEVRRRDYDRFLTVLFAPPAAREHLFALYAFNHEIAKVRETVSEPMLGQIRLQWWREAITGVYEANRGGGAVRKHEIVEALGAAVAAARPSRASFEALIDARELDLVADPPATLGALEGYCEASASQLLWLAAEFLGVAWSRGTGPATRTKLRHLGIAWALTGLVRAIPFHARAKRQYIPVEVADAAGLRAEALFALKPSEALCRAVGALAGCAEKHLTEARGAGPADRAARPLVLFGTLTGGYLRLLRRRGHEVMEKPIELSSTAKIARLWWAARTSPG